MRELIRSESCVPVRIALLSDDRLFCDGIARILQSDVTFDVAVCDAVPKLHDIARQGRVDVLLVDSRIDNAVAIAGAGTIAPASLLIAAPDDAAWCGEALCAGASGVLPKQAGGETLISAVRAVADGSVWAPRRVMAECIRHLVTASIGRRDGTATLDRHLSQREREIFRHAATGLGNKNIARQLAIGEATVKAHLTSIFQKLGVRGRAELAALYHGVVTQTGKSASPRGFLPRAHTPLVVIPTSNATAAAGAKK
jgi:DNA-binding NarL/FixJ family response regulator